MHFIKLNRHKFASVILGRGLEYQEMGNVEILNYNQSHVNAIVDGTKPYEVHIEFAKDGHITRHSCSCPYHESGKLCKHIAAVLYELDERPDEPINAYPLEDDTSTPFREAMGWKRDEFAAKAIKAFKATSTSDEKEYRGEVARFYRALHEVFGYTSFKDEAMTIYEVYLALLDTPQETNYLSYFTQFTGSQSVISYFFARGLSRPRTKERLLAFIKCAPSIVTVFNAEFINALSPINIFKHLTLEILEIFAKSYRFANENDVEIFIEACEEKDAVQALKIVLKECYYANGRNASQILSFLRSKDDGNGFEPMIDALKAHAIRTSELIPSFVQLPLEERRKVFHRLDDDIQYFYPGAYCAMSLACENEVNQYALKTIDPSSMAALLPILKEMPTAYLEKSIGKYLKRIIKERGHSWMDGETFSCLIEIIVGLSNIPSIAMLLLEQSMDKESQKVAEQRLIYLQAITRLGLERQIGLKPYFEV